VKYGVTTDKFLDHGGKNTSLESIKQLELSNISLQDLHDALVGIYLLG